MSLPSIRAGSCPNFASRLFPNGEFTLAYVPLPSKRDGRKSDKDRYQDRQRLIGLGVEADVEAHQRIRGDATGEYQYREPRPRARKGLRGITGEGKRKIRNGCYLLERRYTRRRLGMLTCTLPEAEWLTDVWAREFSEIVRQYIQEMRRELARKGCSQNVVGCIEIQMKRFDKHGQAAPHLHLIYHSRRTIKEGWAISKEWFAAKWRQVLVNVAKKYIDASMLDDCMDAIEWRAGTRCEAIKKSAEGYIGKYLSKGKDDVKKIIDAGLADCLPKQWYTISKGLLAEIVARYGALDDEIVDALVRNASIDNEKLFSWIKQIDIKVGCDRTVPAWIGKMRTRPPYAVIDSGVLESIFG